MRTIVIGPVISTMLLCANAVAASAETRGITANQSLVQSAQTQPTAPNGSEAAAPHQQPQSGSSTEPGSLSRRLSRSGGVIHPPPSGDRSVVTPPNQQTSRTPVIPPPGTPGGNPLIQPK